MFYRAKIAYEAVQGYNAMCLFNQEYADAMSNEKTTIISDFYIPRLKDLDLSGFTKFYVKSGNYTKPSWTTGAVSNYSFVEKSTFNVGSTTSPVWYPQCIYDFPQFLNENTLMSTFFLNRDDYPPGAANFELYPGYGATGYGEYVWAQSIEDITKNATIPGTNAGKIVGTDRFDWCQAPPFRISKVSGKDYNVLIPNNKFPNLDTNSLDLYNAMEGTYWANGRGLESVYGEKNAKYIYGINNILRDNNNTKIIFDPTPSNVGIYPVKNGAPDKSIHLTWGGNSPVTTADYIITPPEGYNEITVNTYRKYRGGNNILSVIDSTTGNTLYDLLGGANGVANTGFGIRDAVEGQIVEVQEKTISNPLTFSLIYDDENDEFYAIRFTTSLYNVEYGVNINCGMNVVISPLRVNNDAIVVNMTNAQLTQKIKDFFFNGTMPEPEASTPDYEDEADTLTPEEDPYKDIYNKDNVGGSEIDLTDVIQTDDGGPNTLENEFILAKGMYGAYALLPNDLVNYVETLQMFYDHSADLLTGIAANLFANRVEQNTQSIFLLPFRVPADVIDATKFVVGFVGIKSQGRTWDDYVNDPKNSIAPAMYLTSSTFVSDKIPIKCRADGQQKLRHMYDNFLDYEPYSSAYLYIPYIGEQKIPMNILYDKNLSLQYRVNLLNGDFIAILYADDVIIKQYEGNCAKQIQLFVNNDSAAINAGLSKLTSVISSAFSGNLALGPLLSIENGGKAGSSLGATGATGTSGWLGSQKIYLTIERPIEALPQNFAQLIGNRAEMTTQLKNLKGYNVIKSIHVRCSATEQEKEEIESLLKSGVIF